MRITLAPLALGVLTGAAQAQGLSGEVTIWSWDVAASSLEAAAVGFTAQNPGVTVTVEDLGNARLLTMRGDGHTAYGGQSACIDTAVEAYLTDLVLPGEGATCEQEVPFTAPAAEEAPVDEAAPAEEGAARLARR